MSRLLDDETREALKALEAFDTPEKVRAALEAARAATPAEGTTFETSKGTRVFTGGRWVLTSERTEYKRTRRMIEAGDFSFLATPERLKRFK